MQEGHAERLIGLADIQAIFANDKDFSNRDTRGEYTSNMISIATAKWRDIKSLDFLDQIRDITLDVLELKLKEIKGEAMEKYFQLACEMVFTLFEYNLVPMWEINDDKEYPTVNFNGPAFEKLTGYIYPKETHSVNAMQKLNGVKNPDKDGYITVEFNVGGNDKGLAHPNGSPEWTLARKFNPLVGTASDFKPDRRELLSTRTLLLTHRGDEDDASLSDLDDDEDVIVKYGKIVAFATFIDTNKTTQVLNCDLGANKCDRPTDENRYKICLIKRNEHDDESDQSSQSGDGVPNSDDEEEESEEEHGVEISTNEENKAADESESEKDEEDEDKSEEDEPADELNSDYESEVDPQEAQEALREELKKEAEEMRKFESDLNSCVMLKYVGGGIDSNRRGYGKQDEKVSWTNRVARIMKSAVTITVFLGYIRYILRRRKCLAVAPLEQSNDDENPPNKMRGPPRHLLKLFSKWGFEYISPAKYPAVKQNDGDDELFSTTSPQSLSNLEPTDDFEIKYSDYEVEIPTDDFVGDSDMIERCWRRDEWLMTQKAPSPEKIREIIGQYGEMIDSKINWNIL